MSSGVEVAKMMRSRSAAAKLAISRARVEALVARCTRVSPGARMWRSLIPVRDTIHSSSVSTSCRQGGGRASGRAGGQLGGVHMCDVCLMTICMLCSVGGWLDVL